ncbi:hypothetical protein [Ureibacillus xyleni]|nr:hypothetical protein [Ureibacillus xyleni]
MKIAKFKDLEVRQDRLIREMDDAISVYLIEMREENDRLIKELSKVNKIEHISNLSAVTKNDEDKESNAKNIDLTSPSSSEVVLQTKTVLPNLVKKAYQQQKSFDLPQQKNDEEINAPLKSFEEKVIDLFKAGKSVEEIAKETQKGKTEIELLLKFHS